MANRRLGKVPDKGKLKIGDVLVFVGGMMLCGSYIPDSVPYNLELKTGIALLLLLLGAFFNFRRLAPRPCWQRAFRSGAIVTLLWAGLPWAFYGFGWVEFDEAKWISLGAVVWLVITIIAFFRWRYIRRRSQEIILRLRLERKRQRRLGNI